MNNDSRNEPFISELEQAGIWRRYHHARLRDLDLPSSLRARVLVYMKSIEERIRLDSIGMFITGPDMSGKSTVANLVAVTAVSRKIRTVVTNVSRLVTARFYDRQGGGLFDAAMDAEFLVIDDLGYPDEPDRLRQSLLHEIVKECDAKRHALAITTRLPLRSADPDVPAISSCYGRAVSDTVALRCLQIEMPSAHKAIQNREREMR